MSVVQGTTVQHHCHIFLFFVSIRETVFLAAASVLVLCLDRHSTVFSVLCLVFVSMRMKFFVHTGTTCPTNLKLEPAKIIKTDQFK